MRLLKTIIKFHIPHIGELMLAFFYLKNTLLQITKRVSRIPHIDLNKNCKFPIHISICTKDIAIRMPYMGIDK